jgi:hypothetical protein
MRLRAFHRSTSLGRDMKSLVRISLIAFVSASCQESLTPAKNWSFADSIGLAVLKSGKTCLSIHNASLAAKSRIRLVITSPPQTEADAQVSKSDASCPGTGAGLQRYEVRADNARLAPSMPVIAVVGFSGKFNRRGGLVTADLDGDGQEEYFRSCTSTEGIHFTVWSGKPLDGKLRWHEYYYLGYDVSPTCAEKEAEPPK